jgi:hypothetical protein
MKDKLPWPQMHVFIAEVKRRLRNHNLSAGWTIKLPDLTIDSIGMATLDISSADMSVRGQSSSRFQRYCRED